MLSWWRDAWSRPGDEPAKVLYGAASTWSREARLFSELGVSDTIDGRLEMLLLHISVLVHRLGRISPQGNAMATAVTEAYIEHMDDTMRHVGVSDLKVPAKIKKAAAALYDAHHEYGAALSAGDDARSAWRHALHLHLISRGAAPKADIDGLASYVLGLQGRLASISDADLLAGRLR